MEGGIEESLQYSFDSSETPRLIPSSSFSAEADDDDLSRQFGNLSIGSSFDLAEGASQLRRKGSRTPSHVGNSPYLLSSRSLSLQESVSIKGGEDQCINVDIISQYDISTLISGLKQSLQMQLEATKILTALSVSEEGMSAILSDDDAIRTIVDLLRNSTLELQMKVAFLVESLASRCTKDQYSRCVNFVPPLMTLFLKCVSDENHDDSNNAGVSIQELGVGCVHTICLLSKDCSTLLQIAEQKGILLLTNNNALRKDKLLVLSEKILKKIIEAFLGYQYCVECNECPFKLIRTNHPTINLIKEQLIQHVVQDVELPSGLRTGAISVVGSLSGVLPPEDLQGLISPLVGQLNDKNLNVAKEALTVLLSFVKRDELLKYHVCLAILEVHGNVILEGWLRLHPHELASNGCLLLKALAGEFERKRLPELYYSSNELQFQISSAIKDFEKAETSVLVFDEYEEEYYISEEDESSDDNVDGDKQKDDSIFEENVETIG